jgi:hypothetical protein
VTDIPTRNVDVSANFHLLSSGTASDRGKAPRRVPHGTPPTPLMTFGPCERLARRTELFYGG